MSVTLFLGQNVNIDNYDLDATTIIGVDKGALILAQAGVKCDISVGDFDSVTPEDIKLIESNSRSLIKLNKVKDETDTERALKEAYRISDDVTILGGIQGHRIEHLIANICLMMKHKTLKMMDDDSIIYLVDKDSFFIKDEYKYISFFSTEDSIISLEGFKYNLNNYNLKPWDSICVSNELVENGEIIIHKGNVLVIKSKDDIKNR